MRRPSSASILLAVAAITAAACAGGPRIIRGTRVADTPQNREILEIVEKYRIAVEARDATALLNMASPSYWEDGGTPTGADDYGYAGLSEVLATRFQRAADVRYSMRYLGVRRSGTRAFVDVLVDASWTIETERGPSRLDKRDQNQLILEQVDGRWRFVGGM